MRKVGYYILGTFICVVLWWSIVPWVTSPARDWLWREGPGAKTQIMIWYCYVLMHGLTPEERGEMLEKLRLGREPLSMNSLLLQYIRKGITRLEGSPKRINKVLAIKNGLLVDAWGIPLRVAVKDGPLQFQVLPEALRKADVAVWSCGPNHIDEWGHGDDVFPKF